MNVRRDRRRTLLLDANGFTWRAVLADSVAQGIFGMHDYEAIPPRLRTLKGLRTLTARYAGLSYLADWRNAFIESPGLQAETCNVSDLVSLARVLRRIDDYDLIVVLHAAATDSLTFLQRAAGRLRTRRGKLAVFIGNEYDLMDEKTRFLRSAVPDLICTQLPIECGQWLYADCPGEVIAMPHALNPDLYKPGPTQREYDLAFSGWMYRAFIGDAERTDVIRASFARAEEMGLRCRFHEGTLVAREWAEFLRATHGTVGAESGTHYLDRRGALIGEAKRYEDAHPSVTAEEICSRFFAHPRVPVHDGKCVSSRHFEAIGAKTCQILLEGAYNGLLEPDVHYISVQKDMSDLDAALERFADPGERRRVADEAYEHVLARHTYAHRVAQLLDAVE